jgi:hypothetical protein
MDLHVFIPGSTQRSSFKNGKEIHDTYGNDKRVGWNYRNNRETGGIQDVDYTSVAPIGYIPVENITFPSIDKLPEGIYTFKIHNWQLRTPTFGGFFNEFLPEELMKSKHVFEALSSKMKVKDSNNQLSGIGFSTTKHDSFIIKVKGSFNRTLKVQI